MNPTKFSYIQQHYETGRFSENKLSLENIEDMTCGLTYKGYKIIARRQFTGLLDKNGKEIYEGDVVNTPNGNWGVIQYDAPYFGVTVSATQVSCYTRGWLESCEVIGNIYENPDLLSR